MRSMNSDMLDKVRTSSGFLAALDQSGGSTPKALLAYGIEESEYDGDDEMFDLVHAMRTRIITSPAFDGERVLGAMIDVGRALGPWGIDGPYLEDAATCLAGIGAYGASQA